MTSSRHFAFTRTDLLAVIVMVLLAAGIGLPILNQRRAESRRLFCEKRQVSIGKAVLQFEQTRSYLPSFAENVAGRTASWQVSILPFLHYDNEFETGPLAPLYDRFGSPDFTATLISDMICPADGPPSAGQKPGWCSWVMNTGMPDSPMEPHDWPSNGVAMDVRALAADAERPTSGYIEQHDGVGYTMLFSENMDSGSWLDATERQSGFVWVANVAGGRAVPGPDLLSVNGDTGRGDGTIKFARPSSFHVGGVNVMWCDGRVQFLSDRIDYLVYSFQMTPDGSTCRHPGSATPVGPPYREADETESR